VISITTLKRFWEQYPAAEQPLKAWLDEVRKASWQSPMEIKEMYRSASILKNSRVVFNIKGNDYRLVTSIFYAAGWVYIKFIGTHKDYDKIDANSVEMKEAAK
ncbi:type II toxin-antitoxin system HigB family toxin, partial [Serratia marcescens]|uniref:type II toxin-antitoxin system HigB family toxin n=1 Tax=Serratia marcescens TaxID=615 RepID=UPI0024A78F39